MKDPSVEFSKELKTKLGKIDKLLQDKEYKEALAEIRDFESCQQIDGIPFEELFQFYYLKVSVLRHLGNYDEALDSGNKAFSIVKDTGDSERIAEAQYILGSIYISRGDLRNAEIEIRDAQTGFRRDSDHRGMIKSLNQLAYIESIKGNYSKSVDLLYDALKYCEQVNEERYKTILHGELGERFLMMGKWDKAKENLLMNVKLNEKAGDEINLCRGLLSLGYVYFLKRKFEESQEAYKKSLTLIQKNNCVRELTIYHEFFGELAFAQGNYPSAREHYDKVIDIMGKIAPEGDMISQTYRLLAELQIEQKQLDQALSSCERSLKIATSLDEKIEIAAIHRALGQIYTAKKEITKAKESFDKSISILEQIGARFELGKSCMEAGQSKCLEYFDRLKFLGKAEDVFRELESRYHVGLVNLALSQLFFENNETEKSELFLNSAEKIFQELSEEKELKLISDLKKRLSPTSLSSESSQAISFSDIITQSPAMLTVIEKARQIKDSQFTILLEGETGTGKDLLAKAIHLESRKKNKPFVSVNCAAIPKDLVESELFGYKKGAFTGATADKKGLLEEAEGGTLFLNEVADLPSITQAKLLGAIEEKQLTRLGETKPRRVNFRVIAASNKDLEKEVRAGNFREDLFYRLSVIKLVLPPLRERKGDIPLLVDYFLKKHFGGEERGDINIHSRILKIFEGYRWPGNVRELQNEIIKLISLKREENGNEFKHLTDKFFSSDEFSQNDPPETDNSLYDQVAEYEKKLILRALEENDWIKTKAARALRIPVTTLKNKIRRYGITRPL